jgi:hypothetical protein
MSGDKLQFLDESKCPAGEYCGLVKAKLTYIFNIMDDYNKGHDTNHRI